MMPADWRRLADIAAECAGIAYGVGGERIDYLDCSLFMAALRKEAERVEAAQEAAIAAAERRCPQCGLLAGGRSGHICKKQS